MQRHPASPSKKIICSLNDSESESSFADLNPLPHRSNKKSTESELVESIEMDIPIPSQKQGTKPRSVVVSQELSVEADETSKSMHEASAQQAPARIEPSSLGTVEQPVQQQQQPLAPKQPFGGQSKSQIVQQDDQEVKNVKQPYSQLRPSDQLNESVTDSQTLQKKESQTMKNAIISTIVGGMATIVTYLIAKKKRAAFGVGAVVGAITFDTLRKSL